MNYYKNIVSLAGIWDNRPILGQQNRQLRTETKTFENNSENYGFTYVFWLKYFQEQWILNTRSTTLYISDRFVFAIPF